MKFFENHDEIRKLFLDNQNLIDITHQIKNVGPDKKWFIFSHAGIIPTTVKGIRFKQQGNIDKDINDWNAILDSGNGLSLNEVFHLKNIKKLEELFIKVGFISTYRRGPYEFGSILWADYREWLDADVFLDSRCKNDPRYEDPRIPNMVQIFGHSQQKNEGAYWITPNACCLDCRRAFELNTKIGELTMI